MSNQGHHANVTGNSAENVIRCILIEKGYQVKRNSPKYINIYGEYAKPDLFVQGIPGHEQGLIIEVKYQSVGGSVDEKYPFLIENIKTKYPYPTVIVIDGNGYRTGALTWLKMHVDGKKLINIFGINEFLSWTNKLEKKERKPVISNGRKEITFENFQGVRV
jgi:hypothetical protein